MITINFQEFRQLILPEKLSNKPIFDALLSVFDYDMRMLYNQFLIAVENDTYLAEHTSQVGSLTRLLNYLLNETEIYIEDGEYLNKLYLYLKSETRQNKIYSYTKAEYDATPSLIKNYAYNRSEYNNIEYQYDYIINVPASFANYGKLRYLVDLYNPAGKTYRIYQNGGFISQDENNSIE